MSDALIVTERRADGRSRAALMAGRRVEDLLVDPPPDDRGPQPEALYAARIDRLVPKMGAAFARIGRDGTAFIREAKGLAEGQRLMLQIVSYPEPGKAAPATRRVLYKTRTVILTPEAPGVNLSRRIRRPEERERLRAAAEAGIAAEPAPAGEGLILRSLAEGATQAEIAGDIAAARATRRAAEAAFAEVEGPGLVRPAPDAAALALREWQGRAVEEGFAAHGVDEALADAGAAAVPLGCGAWMAVEATRALAAVDVNTGEGFGGDAALTANLAAARDLPRQLRLRGLGGVILVDFAPLPRRERQRIEDALKTSFARDPVETSLAGWTTLGLFEIQRKRERRPLAPGTDL